MIPKFREGDRVEILTGRFAGRLCFVAQVFLPPGKHTPRVAVESPGWAVTRFYEPQDLRLLIRCPLLSGVEIGQNVLGGVLQADSEQGYAIVRFPNGINTVFNQRMAADLAWSE